MKRQKDLIDRLKEASGLESVVELSALCGLRMTLIFDWRRRGHIPEEYHNILREKGMDPHRVTAGEGEQSRLPGEKAL